MTKTKKILLLGVLRRNRVSLVSLCYPLLLFVLLQFVSYNREVASANRLEVWNTVSVPTSDLFIYDGNEVNLHIRQLCQEFGVGYYFALAILGQENPNRILTAVNHNVNGTADYGLWQLNSSWADPEQYNWTCPFENSAKAIKFIAELYKVFGSEWNIAAAYNCGRARVQRGDIPEASIAYANAVYSRYKSYID